jgi:Protein of unknown function (DUF1553)/Protein of unknown function (DUF1549)
MKPRWRCVGRYGIVLLAVGFAAAEAGSTGAGEAGGGDVGALTETIDRMVAAQWADEGVTPVAEADDAEFLRRVSFDLAGKIPAVAEVRDFLDDPRPDRRHRLVDRLLGSPAYVAHFTNIERRRLIPEADSDQRARLLAPGFEAWLRDQIAANAGSDRIAREILSATVADERAQPNRGLERYQKPSPLPFYMAKEVKSENLAASTARLFLGLRLECAQCHNHPFASWTREQFWGFAGFFAGLERRGPEGAFLSPIRELPDRRESAIPGTEKVVPAAFLDGTEPQWRSNVPARVTLADWITAADNPYFARASVNRIWAHLFGVGLVDPVDDMGADNPPSHPELLDALARALVAHDHDPKFLIRAIVLSRPYQLTSAATDPDPTRENPRLFARMPVRGLSARQLYDSLALAVGMPADELTDRVTLGVNTPRSEFLEKFDRREEKPADAQTSILQALALMNGRLVAGATRLEEGGTLAAVAEAPFFDTRARVEALFLATLSRRPRPDESDRLVAYLESGGAAMDPRKALSDVFWALLNSPEFMTNH